MSPIFTHLISMLSDNDRLGIYMAMHPIPTLDGAMWARAKMDVEPASS